MERQALLQAWHDHYRRQHAHNIVGALRTNLEFLEGRMRLLGGLPQSTFHKINKRALQSALGLSYGVHKQLLWWLTSVSSGGKVRGGGRG